MNAEDLQRFAEDLRLLTSLTVEVSISTDPDGLHTLRINGADFFFHADGPGYDGWGKALVPGFPL
jgi:hypothetical protein